MTTQDVTWSEWLNFNKENISKTYTKPGVLRMHAAMKILYIGNTENLQNRLYEALEESCICDASRYCYIETSEHEQLKNDLIQEYKEKHDGKLPKCMEEI